MKKQPNPIQENHTLKNKVKKLETDLKNWKTLYAQTIQNETLLKRKNHMLIVEGDRLTRQINQLREQIEIQQKMINEMEDEINTL